MNGAKIDSKSTVIKENRKKDRYSADTEASPALEKEYSYEVEKKEISRIYGDDALLGTTVWQGRIVVDGVVRVPEGSRLIILPGTIVEFKKKDTNGDGIREFDDAALDALQLVPGAGEHQQQEGVHHRTDGRFRLPDADGFQRSAVFGLGFQMLRGVDRRGRWTFDLRTTR